MPFEFFYKTKKIDINKPVIPSIYLLSINYYYLRLYQISYSLSNNEKWEKRIMLIH